MDTLLTILMCSKFKNDLSIKIMFEVQMYNSSNFFYSPSSFLISVFIYSVLFKDTDNQETFSIKLSLSSKCLPTQITSSCKAIVFPY